MPGIPIDRWRRVFFVVAGALPVVTLVMLFRLFNLVSSQVTWPRAFGLAAVFAGLILALAAVLSGLAVGLRLDREGWRRGWRLGFFTLALVNLALVGLVVFWGNIRLAPMAIQVGALALGAVMIVAFARYREAEQVFVTRLAAGLGWIMLVVPILSTPVVVWAAFHDVPRLPASPLPPPPGPARAGAPKRVILVTFDALRARSTSMVDPAKNLTPALAAMAKESAYFPHTYAASDRTRASMPSLLSGVGADHLLIRDANKAGFGRAGAVTSLAGYLKTAGYQGYFSTMLVNPLVFGQLNDYEDGYSGSGLFHSNRFNAASFLPVREAFQYLGEKLSGRWSDLDPPSHEVLTTRRTFEEAERMLKAHAERTFMWVHIGAPHEPYYDLAPADYEGPLQVRGRRRVTEHDVTHSKPEQVAEYERIYERYVRFADHEFGRFRAGLVADGLWDDALVVVTSDHGEEFYPEREPHGSGNLSQDVTHVPLLIHRPGQHQALRDDRTAGHLDVVPTVLEQVLSQVPSGFEGRSVFAPEDPDHVVYTWARFNRIRKDFGGDAASAYQGRYRYWVVRKDEETLYDLRQDPRGLKDVSAQHPEVLAHMRTLLRKRLGQ